jgi:hypothetical protein
VYPQRRCEAHDKLVFATEMEAMFALAQALRKRKTQRSRNERRIYKSDLCKGWHLTSQERITAPPYGQIAPKPK